ncbi:hypothetical protein HanHA300_Chr14g0509151 [Helianthus annuus]|nr:hypothetical protein HanHA300_Chr14g0509151 [Helianthus annuus]
MLLRGEPVHSAGVEKMRIGEMIHLEKFQTTRSTSQEESHPPGKDPTKKISNFIGKAANFAKSAKSKKERHHHMFLHIIPTNDGHNHRKGSHGDTVFLTNHGEVYILECSI